MKYFAGVKTLEELKKLYKTLALKNHPDRGGDVEVMKAINVEYEEAFARVKNIHVNAQGETYEKENKEQANEFTDIIENLIHMQGITIEIIGCFVWVGGGTKQYKEALKEMGFKWHSTKKLWYRAPADYKKRSRRKYEMDEIRNMYGSQTVETANKYEIKTA